jgi:intracellular multiplication protein IcmS
MVEKIMDQELNKQLINIANHIGAKFSLNSSQMPLEEVFSETGMLPAIARRADQLSSLCLGYGIGIKVEDLEASKLGMKVTFDDVTPNILRYLCILDVITELLRNKDPSGVAALDELMYD